MNLWTTVKGIRKDRQFNLGEFLQMAEAYGLSETQLTGILEIAEPIWQRLTTSS